MKYREAEWGMSGLGVAGSVQIEVDEATSGPEAWEICFEVGSMDLRFPISGTETVSKMLEFAKKYYGETNARLAKEGESNLPAGTPVYSGVSTIELAVPGDYKVWLSKDGELPDRFKFAIMRDDLRIGFDLHDLIVSDLISALEQLKQDLDT